MRTMQVIGLVYGELWRGWISSGRPRVMYSLSFSESSPRSAKTKKSRRSTGKRSCRANISFVHCLCNISRPLLWFLSPSHLAFYLRLRRDKTFSLSFASVVVSIPLKKAVRLRVLVNLESGIPVLGLKQVAASFGERRSKARNGERENCLRATRLDLRALFASFFFHLVFSHFDVVNIFNIFTQKKNSGWLLQHLFNHKEIWHETIKEKRLDGAFYDAGRWRKRKIWFLFRSAKWTRLIVIKDHSISIIFFSASTSHHEEASEQLVASTSACVCRMG